VRLHGRVLWGDAANARRYRNRVRELRPYVNAFQQAPVRLVAPSDKDAMETPFAVDLLLTRAGENQVRLLLPGLPVAEGSQRRLVLTCRKPETRLRLHLLIVSLRDVAPEALQRQVLDSLRLPRDKAQLPGESVFSDYKVYGPLTGNTAKANYLFSQLEKMRDGIQTAASTAPGSDVVVIYYEGGEEITDEGNVFRLSAGGPAAGRRLSFARLAERASGLGGAALLFLDVDRPKGDAAGVDRIARWPDHADDAERNLSILRYAWTDPGGAPKKGALLKALEQSVKEGKRLADVTERLKRIAAGYRDKGDKLLDDQRVPKDLLLLPVRAGN
jgi:hypothetical protein